MDRPPGLWLRLLLFTVAVTMPGAACVETPAGPAVTLSINAISEELDDLLVLPPSGFVLHVGFTPAGAEVDPQTFSMTAYPWSSATPVVLTGSISVDASGGKGIVSAAQALTPGSYTLLAEVKDAAGRTGIASHEVAIRDFPNGAPPIGSGQKIWFDFTVDRDGDTEPDFPDDLESFGLASPADPTLAAEIESQVISRVLDRIETIYHDEDPNGLGADPVDVAFSTSDPGGSDVTRICVGGQAPGTPLLIGSIFVDVDNLAREGDWCSSIPATGLFPRGIHAWSGGSSYQSSFGPVLPSLGGTPIGEHALDPIVYAAGFDPGSATPEELTRWNETQNAIQRFSDVLASITAHETGHALGLVAPGMPGAGLHGGTVGATYSHNVEADGTSHPAENYLMKAGSASSFASLAGMGSHPLPFLRPFDHAYLRDRVVRDEKVSEILAPPAITGIDPLVVTGDGFVTITGANFAPTPTVTLEGLANEYPLLFMQYDSETQVRGFVSHSQVVPAFYFLVLENPDGQLAYGLIQVD